MGSCQRERSRPVLRNSNKICLGGLRRTMRSIFKYRRSKGCERTSEFPNTKKECRPVDSGSHCCTNSFQLRGKVLSTLITKTSNMQLMK